MRYVMFGGVPCTSRPWPSGSWIWRQPHAPCPLQRSDCNTHPDQPSLRAKLYKRPILRDPIRQAVYLFEQSPSLLVVAYSTCPKSMVYQAVEVKVGLPRVISRKS